MAYGVRNIKLDSNKPCDIFNLGSESITKVIDIANMVKEEMKLYDAEILIEGSEKAWPGDQPRVHISVDKMKDYKWLRQGDIVECMYVTWENGPIWWKPLKKRTYKTFPNSRRTFYRTLVNIKEDINMKEFLDCIPE